MVSTTPSLNGIDERPRWRRNVRLYPWFYFFHNLQFFLPIWIVFALDEVGLTFAQLTAIGPAFYVITSFGQAPAGAIADRFGRVRVMRAAVAIYIVFIIWFAFSASFWQAAVAWSLWGLSMVMLTGTDSAFLHDSLQALGRSRDFERQAGRAFAVRSFAMVAATFIGGVFAGLLGMQATVIVCSIGSGLALLIAFGFREPPSREHGSGVQALSYMSLMKETLRLAGKTPTIRYSLIFSAILVAALVPEFYLIQPFLREQGVDVGWLFTALQAPPHIATVIAAALAFWLAVRLGIVRTLSSMPFWVVGVYVGIALWNELGAIALFAVLGFARGAQMPLMEGYLNRRIPSHLRATALSLNHMGWALIMLPFLPIFGQFVEANTMPTIFFGLAGFFGPLLLIIMILWVRADRQERGRLRLPQAIPALLREVLWKPQQQPSQANRPIDID